MDGRMDERMNGLTNRQTDRRKDLQKNNPARETRPVGSKWGQMRSNEVNNLPMTVKTTKIENHPILTSVGKLQMSQNDKYIFANVRKCIYISCVFTHQDLWKLWQKSRRGEKRKHLLARMKMTKTICFYTNETWGMFPATASCCQQLSRIFPLSTLSAWTQIRE